MAALSVRDRARRLARPLGACAAVCLVLAIGEQRFAPFPSAEPSRGTEEAFSRMPFRRALAPRQPPARWLMAEDRLAFCDVPVRGTLEVRLSRHTAPVAISIDRLRSGSVSPGETQAASPVPALAGRCFEVTLEPTLGAGAPGYARLERLSVRHERGWAPSVGAGLLLALPPLVFTLCAIWSGASGATSAAAGAALAVLRTAFLWPGGLHRSPYSATLSVLLILGALAALGFATACERRVAGAGTRALASVFVAFLVQVVVATSPVMVVSDLLFHAHKLASVVDGDYFPVSVTQHARPFTIPYGVSFYALLAPLARAGLDPVVLVRFGAGLAGVAASAGLFLLALPQGAPFAMAATVLLQLVPATVDAFSYGNFNHAFGHALTLLFFCWWTARRPGGWPLGGALFALGATAHLASSITLAFLCACLVATDRKAAADRTRLFALAFGLGMTALYYSHFVPTIAAALPGLGRGYGQTGQTRPFLDRLWFEVQWARIRWGLPAGLLALVGWPRPSRGPFERCLLAFWTAGGLLALAALFSPLDVRYLYALTPALALSAARGALGLWAAGGRWRAATVMLLLAQAAIGVGNITEAVYLRYRF